MGPVRIVELHEREVRLFQREELFDQKGQTLLLPETRSLSAVELREVFTGIELRVLGLIGYLPLTSSLALNLTPKFPIANLWQMLDSADENYDRVLPILRPYEHANDSAPNQLLTRSFCFYLREILSVGVTRGYSTQEYEGHFKPKIHFGRTVARFLSRGEYVRVAGSMFVFSFNAQLNSLLKSACKDFLRIMPQGEMWQSERLIVLDALNALFQVTPSRMLIGEESIANLAPIWLRDSYYGALRIYAILLGHSNIGFSYDAKGTKLPSFLFRLDEIFESFVRNSLRNGLQDSEISVVDGNKPRHQQPLFNDNRQFVIKPDALIRRRKNVVAVCEVKYKPKIHEVDRYQVISHVVSSCSPLGIWISPAREGENADLNYVGTMANGAKFYHYRLNVFGDLDLALGKMIGALQQLIKSH